ncbi:MAG: hypothetical protein ED557_03015 [Balneola sp.]|nr:MAG: hypothetical protein ED557_03015 [Balneola sp.]
MEQWKDKILASANGIQKATPPEDAFSKILDKIDQDRAEVRISKVQLVAAAAILLITMCVNILLISSQFNSEEPTESTAEYSEIISSYNLY